MKWKKRNNILLIVTGSIACYKSIEILRLLKKSGKSVRVILTRSAERFVMPLSFASLGAEKVYTDNDQFIATENGTSLHIALAEWADYILVAPATANTIAKIRMGIADNLALSTIVAFTKTIFIAPAMNVNMFENPVTAENIDALKKRGMIFIGPEEGALANFTVDKGRLTEPDKIVRFVCNATEEKLFKNKRFLVTAGATRAYIDPVRFITNGSSGRMGIDIAEEAKLMGGYVHLIAGSLLTEPVAMDKIDYAITTNELFSKAKEAFKKSDILIMAAAPVDFIPKKTYPNKIKKRSHLNMEFLQAVDILKSLQNKDNKVIIGFALETENIEKNALKKMKEKGMDIVVANEVSNMGSDRGSVLIMDKTGRKKFVQDKTKREIAKEVLLFLKEFLYKEV